MIRGQSGKIIGILLTIVLSTHCSPAVTIQVVVQKESLQREYLISQDWITDEHAIVVSRPTGINVSFRPDGTYRLISRAGGPLGGTCSGSYILQANTLIMRAGSESEGLPTACPANECRLQRIKGSAYHSRRLLCHELILWPRADMPEPDQEVTVRAFDSTQDTEAITLGRWPARTTTPTTVYEEPNTSARALKFAKLAGRHHPKAVVGGAFTVLPRATPLIAIARTRGPAYWYFVHFSASLGPDDADESAGWIRATEVHLEQSKSP